MLEKTLKVSKNIEDFKEGKLSLRDVYSIPERKR